MISSFKSFHKPHVTRVLYFLTNNVVNKKWWLLLIRLTTATASCEVWPQRSWGAILSGPPSDFEFLFEGQNGPRGAGDHFRRPAPNVQQRELEEGAFCYKSTFSLRRNLAITCPLSLGRLDTNAIFFLHIFSTVPDINTEVGGRILGSRGCPLECHSKFDFRKARQSPCLHGSSSMECLSNGVWFPIGLPAQEVLDEDASSLT